MTPRKTATELKDLIIAQLETSLSTTIPLLPKSFCRVLAKALGGVFVLLYNFASWILLQMFPQTASNEDITVNGVTINPLRMWGSLVEIEQDAGVHTERSIEITVLIQTGSLISGQRVVNPATQMIYVLVGDVALSSPTVTAVIKATVPGEIGNVDAGETLNLVDPPSTVEKEVVVLSSGGGPVFVNGSDPEDTEVFRQHVTDRYAARPQGGAYADYRDWAQAVPGVLNAYPYSGWSFVTSFPSGGPGFVFVFIESIADPDGIPPDPGALLTAVAANIELDSGGIATRRNINAKVIVKPITRTAINVTVHGLYSDEDTTAAQAAVDAALEEFFLDRGPFILGLHPKPRKDIITSGEVGGVVAMTLQSYGAAFSSSTIDIGAGDLDVYALQEGEKAKLGTLSWV